VRTADRIDEWRLEVRITYTVTRADPIGGVQIHVRDLATALRAQGHSPTVVTSGSGPFIDDLRAADIPVVVVRHLCVPIHPIRDVRALQELHATLQDLRPDLVAAHSSKAGVLSRLVGRFLGVPVVLTAHGWNFTPGIPPRTAAVYRGIERSVGPLTAKIITVSEFDRRLTLEARIVPPARVVTVHNGIPDVPRELRADPARTPPRLVMVARFSAQKDHATLLRAMAGLRDQPWELELIGDGPLMGEMQALAAALELGERVRFLGQRTDVEQRLAEAQAGVLSTNWEGFPMSILEAMRAGLPVVASAIAGIGESVAEGETGFLVPRGDVELLRVRLGQLLGSPALRARLGANGRARYEQEFTLPHFVARTLDVYRGVLADVRLPGRASADYAGTPTG
jgi:glycosyltransferase involved in cell wall biosynthesis